MKTIRSGIVGGVALAVLIPVGACDGITDINDNPNEPTDVPAALILPGAIRTATGMTLGNTLNLDLTELWVQHVAEIQYAEEDIYQYRDVEIDNNFRTFYIDVLTDWEIIRRKGADTDMPNHQAVGATGRSWTFSVMTDLWGDIPYSEALGGLDEDGSLSPAYDPQRDIYEGLLSDLREANTLYAAEGGTFGSADLIYGGDMDAWQRFTNSLRLRLAMRLAETDLADLAQAEFVDALGAGVFTSNDDNATLVYQASLPNVHPWYNNFRTRDDHRVSATLVDTLQALNDPRLAVYARPATLSDTYVGMPNGLETHDFGLEQTSRIGEFFAAATTPALIQTYAEVLFLQAEAVERGWISGDAEALYEAGIRASMELLGIAEADIAAYLAEPSVQYDAANWRASIGLQQWLALFSNGPEAYAVWRRLGYPQLTPGRDAVLDAPPRRYQYPFSEQSLNQANLNSAISRQGGAGQLDPVWWDSSSN